MANTFYFYDLETSGLNPREARIMQFGGQRTDMDLKPIGEPHNVLIKMNDDIVPDPYSVLVTSITPQQTIAEGVTEAEFLKLFYREIATPGTIFVGYNTVRFDDEFVRYLLWRNFYDPYEWQYKDSRSRWDLLDVVRMMRALRPKGIKWPKDKDGKPTNQLGLLTALNDIKHDGAHDALSDVGAVIALAQLIYKLQPKLFKFLLNMREKSQIATLIDGGEPFVYTSGKYPSEFEKTTITIKLANHPRRSGALVYDLRHDPTAFVELSPEELAHIWQWRKDDPSPRLPVKSLQYNRCPAVAPLGVLDKDSQKRIGLTTAIALSNHKKLVAQKGFVERVMQALEILDAKQDRQWAKEANHVDARLYDGFLSAADKRSLKLVHEASPEQLSALEAKFGDARLKELLFFYKARTYPGALTTDEHLQWEQYRAQQLVGGGEASRLARYFATIEQLRTKPKLSKQHAYLLDELQLYGESLMPEA